MSTNHSRTMRTLSALGLLLAACAEPSFQDAEPDDTQDLPQAESVATDDFINRAAPGAQRGQEEFGVPASVTIAQAILESGWGKYAPGNNYFGIKCAGPSSPGPIANGCRAEATTECRAKNDCYRTTAYFRTYATMDDSMRDHGSLLHGQSNYARAFQYQDDPDSFIREVKNGGYATDPDYVGKIVGLMRDYDLYRFNRKQKVDPIGSLDVAEPLADGKGIRVAGWTFDQDAVWINNSVHVYVDDVGFDIGPAKVSRPDVDAAYPGVTPTHGFDTTVAFTRGGKHKVCAYGINWQGSAGGNALLGCKEVTVPNPFGAVDEVTAVPGGIRVRGWTVDADGVWLNNAVHVYVGKQGFDIGPAKVSRPDVDAAYPGVTPYHGFDTTVAFTASGTYDVCIYAINAPGTRGDNVLLACKTITR